MVRVSYLYNKLVSELERGFKIYLGYKIWFITNLLISPFWVLFITLGFMFYAEQYLSDIDVVTGITWGILIYLFVASQIAIADSMLVSIQEGIIENLLLTNTGITLHLLGRCVISFINLALIAPPFLLISYFLFGSRIHIADPLFLVIFMIIATFFFIFFAAILGALYTKISYPTLITQPLQLLIPFFSGAIPVHLFYKDFANIMFYSPFFYVISPISASVTGYYFMDKFLLLGLSLLSLFIMMLISLHVQRIFIKKTLKKGNFTLF